MNCQHGQMVRRQGQGSDGPWAGWFCPLGKGDPNKCKAVYDPKPARQATHQSSAPSHPPIAQPGASQGSSANAGLRLAALEAACRVHAGEGTAVDRVLYDAETFARWLSGESQDDRGEM